MKHFKYLPIILGLPFVTLLASCALNSNDPSTHVGNSTGTNDSIIQLTLKQASLVFDDETEKLTVHFSVNENIDDSIELRASFRLESEEGHYLHLDEVKNEQAFDLSSLTEIHGDTIYDGTYTVTLDHIHPKEGTTLSNGLEIRSLENPVVLKDKLVIKRKIRFIDAPVLSNVKIESAEQLVTENDEADWHIKVTYDFNSSGYVGVPFVCLYNQDDQLISFNNLASGQDWNVGNLKQGEYYVTVQMRGFSEGGHFGERTTEYLNSQVVKSTNTFVVEREKEVLKIEDINIYSDGLITWECNKEDATFEISIKDFKDDIYYSATETKTYHKIDYSVLNNVYENRFLVIKATGDQNKYVNSREHSEEIPLEFFHSDKTPKLDNDCVASLNYYPKNLYWHRSVYIKGNFTCFEDSFSNYSYITIYDADTGKILLRRNIYLTTYLEEQYFDADLDLTYGETTKVRIEIFVKDPTRTYKDFTKTYLLDTPKSFDSGHIDDIIVDKVNDHLEIEVKASGEYDEIEVKYEDGYQHTDITEIVNGKYILRHDDLDKYTTSISVLLNTDTNNDYGIRFSIDSRTIDYNMPCVDDIVIERVENHLEVEVKTSGYYDEMTVMAVDQGEIWYDEESWTIITETKDGKYIIPVDESVRYYQCKVSVRLSIKDESGEIIESIRGEKTYSEYVDNYERVFEDMVCTMSQRKSDDGYVYLTFNIESDINYYPDFTFKLMHGKYFIDGRSLGSNYDETIGTSSKVLTIKFRAGDMVSGDEYTIVIECQKRKYRDEEVEENEMVYMRYTQTFTLN